MIQQRSVYLLGPKIIITKGYSVTQRMEVNIKNCGESATVVYVSYFMLKNCKSGMSTVDVISEDAIT